MRVGLFLITGWSFLSGQTNEPLHFFDHLTTKEGLSYSRVRSFFQDSTGFIWVGTEQGVHRFDPVSGAVQAWPSLNLSGAAALEGLAVRALREDAQGRLWIVTEPALASDWP